MGGGRAIASLTSMFLSLCHSTFLPLSLKIKGKFSDDNFFFFKVM